MYLHVTIKLLGFYRSENYELGFCYEFQNLSKVFEKKEIGG